MGKRILVIADIEGSSGCLTRESAKLLGKGWPRACLDMSLDVAVLSRALLRAGAEKVQVQDFHRTGYNIFPALVPRQTRLAQGYQAGPVPGLGSPKNFDSLMMVGMHAPSGTKGFLAHTLTSRIAAVTVKDRLVSEAQLFSAALAPLQIPPVFFSGCPVACGHVKTTLPGVHCFPVEKEAPGFQKAAWRKNMARAAVRSLNHTPPAPYNPQGPFEARITMAGGTKAAEKISRAWGCPFKGPDLFLTVEDYRDLYDTLTRIIYLRPLTFRLMALLLPAYHLMGRTSLALAKTKAPASHGHRG